MYYIISFLLPLILSLVLTPLVIRFAGKVNAIDQPDKRKVHQKPIPRLGGLAVAVSFFISTAIFFLLFQEFSPGAAFQIAGESINNLVIASILLILLLGVWDDITPLKPGIKFFIQFTAATLAFAAGFNISFVSDPFGTGFINLAWLAYPLTILWIVGITNAFNLIDGLDGLASGTAVIALTTISIITLFHGPAEIFLISIILAGSILGFLWYNFRPAKVFLGDSGSLFLGFMLALITIQSFTKVSTSFALLVPFFVLGLPIMDTALSMIRRFLSWFLPEKFVVTNKISFKSILSSIFQPDKSHVHHQLLQKGFSHKHTVLVLYMVSAIFGAGAVAIALTTQMDTIILILLLISGITLVGINKLKYKEIALLHNGIFLNFYNRILINRQSFQKILDFLFIIAAFTGAYLLTQSVNSSEFQLSAVQGIDLSLIIFAAVIQLSVFWLSGLYQETIQQIGIADVFLILKSIVLAVIISTVGIYLAPFWQFGNVFTLLALNFYFLATLVLGLRIFFHLLKHLFRCSRQGNQKVLIYGAGEQGMFTLYRLLSMNSHSYTPLGFLDEDPNLEGKKINGFTVFGGHWKLERLIREQKVESIFVATDHLRGEVQQRVLKLARDYNLTIKKLQVQINELPMKVSKTSNKTTKKILYAN